MKKDTSDPTILNKWDKILMELDAAMFERLQSGELVPLPLEELPAPCEEPVVVIQPKLPTKRQKQLAAVAAMLRKDLNRDRKIRRKIRERAAKDAMKERERIRVVREMMMRQ